MRRVLLVSVVLLVAAQGAAQQPANCPLGYTVVAPDLTVWACRGPADAPVQVSTGGGGGDLLAANNLSDVANATTAFTNIKQAASTTATGVVELATDGESAANVAVQGSTLEWWIP